MKIAIIPARGGSQRIKSKNIVDFLGRPIIAYALEAAEQSALFDKIHVSTDSDEIAEAAKKLGFAIDFKRPDELADNHTGLAPVLSWVLERYRKDGLEYEDVACIMPAAPLLEAEDLKAGYQAFLDQGRKHPLLVVARLPVPAEWAFRRDAAGTLTPASPAALKIRSQDLQPAYYEAGPFSYFAAHHLLAPAENQEVKFTSYEIAPHKAVDIDNPEDLEFARTLYLGQRAKKELDAG
ncbi:MAG: pseudaminic acid cytidylyltransferase [Elusimicrobiota bacterium]